MFGHIKVFWLITAFAIGMCVCYATNPQPEVVFKFPSPMNAGRVTYKVPNTDSCYKYTSNVVDCPSDEKMVKPQPLDA
jgi:hypothetical protein